MPGLGIKNVLQATPVGYLVEMEDGAQRTFPENVLVEAGYVGPTQGLYQDPAQSPGVQPHSAGLPQSAPPVGPPQAPNLGVSPLEAPQVAPPPVPSAPSLAPGMSQRGGYSTSRSDTDFVRRTDVNAPPASLDLSGQRAGLEAAGAKVQAGFADQQGLLGQQADNERRRNEVLNGKFDEGGNLVERGLAQEQKSQRIADAADRRDFDAAVDEYVAKRQAEIDERVARVPQEDPRRIWTENSALQNAAGILAVGLGGFMSPDGPNRGLEAVNQHIQRDIEAQRTNIDNEWKKVAQDQDSLQQYQQWKSRKRQWTLEEQVVRLETLAIDREAEANKFSSASKQAELMGLAAGLRIKAAETSAELLKAEAEYAKAEVDSAHKSWFDQERLSLEKKLTRSSIAENYAQARAADRANQPNPGAGEVNPPIYRFKNGEELYLDPRFASTMRPEDIEKFRQTAAKKDTFLQSYDELIRDVNVMGRELMLAPNKRGLSSPELKALKDRSMKFALDYTNEKAATTFTDRLLDTVVSMSGSPTGLTDVDKTPSMLEFKKSIVGEMDGQFRGRGAFVVGQAAVEGEQPPIRSFDAYDSYGADPRPPAENAVPGRQLQPLLTDVLLGDDVSSQISSLDGLLNYIASPIGGGAGGIGVTGMLRGLEVVDRDGKPGLTSRGGRVASKAEALSRLKAAKARMKSKAPDQSDRIDEMFEELHKYIEKEPEPDTSIDSANLTDPRRFGGVK